MVTILIMKTRLITIAICFILILTFLSCKSSKSSCDAYGSTEIQETDKTDKI
jgi:hypothetical protein